MANELVLEGGVWKLKEASSGGNDPTFPTGDLSVTEDAARVSFNMANGGTTPAAVEFSFSGSSYLEAVDPDAGTASSPSFVVDPDDTPRAIQFVRGATDVPSASTVVTASYSSPSGPVGSFSVTLDPASFFGIVRTIATPTLEFARGLLANSGSLGSSHDWVKAGGTISTSPRSERAVFGGSHLYAATGESISTPAVSSDPFRRDPIKSRTWLIAYESDRAAGWNDSSAYLSPYGDSNTSTPGGLLYCGTGNDLLYYWGAGQVQLNASQSHSDGGSSESLKIFGTYQKLCVVAIVWDFSAETITCYWKQEDHTRGGYSFFSGSSASQGVDTSFQVDIVGKGNASSDGRPLKTFYYGVFDAAMTGPQFQKIINVAGIG